MLLPEITISVNDLTKMMKTEMKTHQRKKIANLLLSRIYMRDQLKLYIRAEYEHASNFMQ